MHETALASAEPAYYTVRQAARKLNISRTTVYVLIREGKLGAFLVRNSLRIGREDIAAYEAALPKEEDLCRVSEVARILQLHPKTVSDLIFDGELQAIRRGGNREREVIRKSLDEYLARVRTGA